MKLTIDGHEVEIKVKNREGKFSTEETMYFLNSVCLAYYHASQFLTGNGFPISARGCEECRSDIYKALEQNGFYSEQKQG